MRHYVRKKQNPHYLPHDLYMQMLYLIRDFDALQQKAEPVLHTPARSRQLCAVEETTEKLGSLYELQHKTAMNPLRAFFDYPYYSYVFAQKKRDMGASKRAWSLYRCRFAHMVAEALRLI